MKPFIFISMGWIVAVLSFSKDGFGIKLTDKVDMLLNSKLTNLSSGLDKMFRLYLKIPDNITHFINLDIFLLVHIPLGCMVKF